MIETSYYCYIRKSCIWRISWSNSYSHTPPSLSCWLRQLVTLFGGRLIDLPVELILHVYVHIYGTELGTYVHTNMIVAETLSIKSHHKIRFSVIHIHLPSFGLCTYSVSPAQNSRHVHAYIGTYVHIECQLICLHVEYTGAFVYFRVHVRYAT